MKQGLFFYFLKFDYIEAQVKQGNLSLRKRDNGKF